MHLALIICCLKFYCCDQFVKFSLFHKLYMDFHRILQIFESFTNQCNTGNRSKRGSYEEEEGDVE